MNILHLIDPGSPGGGACTLRLLSDVLHRLSSVEHDVLLIGARRHEDLARRCGVETIGTICPPIGRPALSWRALRDAIHALEHARGKYDLVHGWTYHAATLAALAAPRHLRLGSATVGPVTGLAPQALKMVMDRRGFPLLAASTAVCREFATLGINDRWLSVLPPGVNPDHVQLDNRDALRRRWGVPVGRFTIGLLSEPTSWADAREAANIVARVVATGREISLVMHHSATRRSEAQRWIAHLNMGRHLIVEDEVAEPWRMVSGLDAALFIGGDLNAPNLAGAGSPFAMLIGGGRRLRPMPGVMPLLWAMSAGVPVIAEASDAVRDIIDDGLSGMLVDQHDVNAAADRVTRLLDDSTVAGRIGMQGRGLAERRYHVSAFCVRLKELYERHLEGRPVKVVSEENTDLIEVQQSDAGGVQWVQHA